MKNFFSLLVTLVILIIASAGCSTNQSVTPSKSDLEKTERQSFEIIDRSQGARGIGMDESIFEITVIPNDNSDSFLIKTVREMRVQFSEEFANFNQVEIYFFEDEYAASKYLEGSPEKGEDYEKQMIANYSYEKAHNFSMLFRMKDGVPELIRKI